jgi:hypothetical protein
MQSRRPTHPHKITTIPKNKVAPRTDSSVKPKAPLPPLVKPVETEISEPLSSETKSLTTKERLLTAEGGYYLSGEASELLGISAKELEEWLETDKLIGLPRKDGTFVYPKWQFSDSSVLSGLEEVLARFPYKSPWGRAAFMLDTWVSVGLGTPLAGLRDGKLSQVLALVNCIGEQGAL